MWTCSPVQSKNRPHVVVFSVSARLQTSSAPRLSVAAEPRAALPAAAASVYGRGAVRRGSVVPPPSGTLPLVGSHRAISLNRPQSLLGAQNRCPWSLLAPADLSARGAVGCAISGPAAALGVHRPCPLTSRRNVYDQGRIQPVGLGGIFSV